MTEYRQEVHKLFLTSLNESIAPSIESFNDLKDSDSVRIYAGFRARFNLNEEDEYDIQNFSSDFLIFEQDVDRSILTTLSELSSLNDRLFDKVKEQDKSYYEETDKEQTLQLLKLKTNKIFDLADGDSLAENTKIPVLPFALLDLAWKNFEIFSQTKDPDTQFKEVLEIAKTGEKPPTDDSIESQIFSLSINHLRKIYYMGQDDTVLKKNLIRIILPSYFQGLPSLEAYTDFAVFFNTFLGANFEKIDNKKLSQHLESIRSMQTQSQYPKQEQKIKSTIKRTLGQMFAVHATRELIDLIIEGEINYSDVHKTLNMASSQPLNLEKTQPKIEARETVDWEILPISKQKDTNNNTVKSDVDQSDLEQQDSPKPTRITSIHWNRIRNLQRIAKDWPDAYFARTKIPNLSDENQYYAVILPETKKDGTVIEHAIADYPAKDNAMYVWRGELGEKTSLTWREVLASKRHEARKLGARRLYHVSDVEIRLLDYLTTPKNKIKLPIEQV